MKGKCSLLSLNIRLSCLLMTLFCYAANSALLTTTFTGNVVQVNTEVRLRITAIDPVSYDPRFKELYCGVIEKNTSTLHRLAHIRPRSNKLELYQSSTIQNYTVNFVNRLSTEEPKTLVIQKLAYTDEGLRLKCVLAYMEGSVTKRKDSTTHNIDTVFGFDNFTMMPSQRLSLNESDTLDLVCHVYARPSPTFLWLKDDKAISASITSNKVITTKINGNNTYTGQLKIQNLKPDDMGKYTCVAKNVGKESSLSISIKVNYLHVLLNTTPLTVDERSQLTLRCQSSGYPRPFIYWLRGNVRVMSNNQTLIKSWNNTNDTTESQLTITRTLSTHSGLYTCVADNLVGQKTEKVMVNILYFRGIKLNTNVTVIKNRGMNYMAICRSEGQPIPELHWYKGTTLLQHGITETINHKIIYSKLHLTNISVSDRGQYTCESVNERQKSSTAFRLQVTDIPGKILTNTTCVTDRTAEICIYSPFDSPDSPTEVYEIKVMPFNRSIILKDQGCREVKVLTGEKEFFVLGKNVFGLQQTKSKSFKNCDSLENLRLSGNHAKFYIPVMAFLAVVMVAVGLVALYKRSRKKPFQGRVQPSGPNYSTGSCD